MENTLILNIVLGRLFFFPTNRQNKTSNPRLVRIAFGESVVDIHEDENFKRRRTSCTSRRS